MKVGANDWPAEFIPWIPCAMASAPKTGACRPVPPMRASVYPFIARKMATVLHIPTSITPIAMPISASVLDPPPEQSM